MNDIDSANIDIDKTAKLEGVVIKAKKIQIKKNATLSECKLFSPGGEIVIGENVTIKERAIINAFRGIRIGDRTVIDRDVYIGGMQSEKSAFEIGSDGVVLYRSYLNTTRKIAIGNNAGIGGYCKIFTHGSWPNALDGGPYRFGDVVIKDNVWISWGIIVMPRVTIKEGAIVGAGSVVTKDVPASMIIAGVPAKVIGKRTALRLDQKDKIMREILEDFGSYSSGFLNAKNSIKRGKNGSVAIEFEKGGGNLCYTRRPDSIKNPSKSVMISFRIPEDIKRQKQNEWIELDTLLYSTKSKFAVDFVAFVRRYGIKLMQQQDCQA